MYIPICYLLYGLGQRYETLVYDTKNRYIHVRVHRNMKTNFTFVIFAKSSEAMASFACLECH